MILALAFSAASVAYFFHAGLITAYSDAQSRLMIARTVLDGRHAGMAQLGGIWPPFPQAFMLPFVWNDVFYRTGLAGTIPSAAAYVASSVFLYKLVTRLTQDAFAGVVGVVAFSGPNILYLQSVPMSELPFIACFLGTVYFTVSWMLRGSLGPLFLAALCACLGTLTRYEGWALVGLLTIAVVAFCWRAGHRREEIEGILLLFGMMAFLGIALWLVWNRLIFGDTLYFLHSQYGTRAINGLQLHAMPAASRPVGNLALSAQVLAWSVIDNVGLLAAVLAILGLGRLALARRFGPATVTAAALLLFPLAFTLVAAYLGAEVIADPTSTPGVGPTNVRYGLLLAPAAGFLAGWLAHGRRARWPVLAACLLSSALVSQTGLVNVTEASAMITSRQDRTMIRAGEWLGTHYDGGLVLMQRRTNEKLLFTSGVALDRVVYEGDRREWAGDLAQPTSSVRWIVMDAGDPTQQVPPDDVWARLHGQPQLFYGFQRVYQDGPIEVYRSVAA
ncbi:MAG TPA: glycosyltransferase family 39 protein [Candidatus Dormibacteraeota bacterium]|nr:glycosyltransferase family 39 protein [Candidatus Dormibacteraeota bacterium]